MGRRVGTARRKGLVNGRGKEGNAKRGRGERQNTVKGLKVLSSENEGW
jgi:hypothetical protein